MNRETCISGERAVTPTGFYLHSVSCENKNDKLIKYLEDKIKDCDYQINIIGNYQKICEKRAYKDILEMVKSGKYD